MAERPIIFSTPMVRALIDGRKTQTRRLATSPLRKCEPGDRLWVRETWKPVHSADPPRGARYRADVGRDDTLWRPSIHMPRWASRITLNVIEVDIELLQYIDECDAELEGMAAPYLGDGDPPFEERATMVSRRMQYRNLWNQLHPKHPWGSNPEVLVLTFTIERMNIDRIMA